MQIRPKPCGIWAPLRLFDPKTEIDAIRVGCTIGKLPARYQNRVTFSNCCRNRLLHKSLQAVLKNRANEVGEGSSASAHEQRFQSRSIPTLFDEGRFQCPD